MNRLPVLSALVIATSAHLLMAQNGPESITFKSGPITLHGSVWKPSNAGPHAAVLYNHGSEREVDHLAALGPVFTSRGYLIFVPERRGHGRSANQGRWVGEILAEERKMNGLDASAKLALRLLETEHLDDQLAALEYLKTRPDVDSNRIAIAGCSFGGIQTLLAGERRTGARAGVDFAGAAIIGIVRRSSQNAFVRRSVELSSPSFLCRRRMTTTLHPAASWQRRWERRASRTK